MRGLHLQLAAVEHLDARFQGVLKGLVSLNGALHHAVSSGLGEGDASAENVLAVPSFKPRPVGHQGLRDQLVDHQALFGFAQGQGEFRLAQCRAAGIDDQALAQFKRDSRTEQSINGYGLLRVEEDAAGVLVPQVHIHADGRGDLQAGIADTVVQFVFELLGAKIAGQLGIKASTGLHLLGLGCVYPQARRQGDGVVFEHAGHHLFGQEDLRVTNQG